jgi:mannose/fructose-specific phosphotransferase system component IIA
MELAWIIASHRRMAAELLGALGVMVGVVTDNSTSHSSPHLILLCSHS